MSDYRYDWEDDGDFVPEPPREKPIIPDVLYTLLTIREYYEMNKEISTAKGYELGEATARLSPMNPQLAKINIVVEDEVETYDLVCIMAIDVEVQESYPETIEDLVFTERKDIIHADTTIDRLDFGDTADWSLQHYNEVGEKGINVLEAGERTSGSDNATLNLQDSGSTIITDSADVIEKFVVVKKNSVPIHSNYMATGIIETNETIELHDDLDIPATDFPVLPDSGTVEEQMYNYNGDTVLCLQRHTRTIYPPEQTPALFSFYREETNGLEWIPNEQVEIGYVRTYNEVEYECIQSHMTLNGWEPDVTPALWQEVVEGIPVWVQPTGAHDAYDIGDQVHFPTIDDPVYESLINDNVWSPTVYPAGWSIIE